MGGASPAAVRAGAAGAPGNDLSAMERKKGLKELKERGVGRNWASTQLEARCDLDLGTCVKRCAATPNPAYLVFLESSPSFCWL